MSGKRLVCVFLVFCMVLLACVPALALDPSTLHWGSKGEEVRKMQQALIDLGYLSGTADGVFGNKTENALRKYQKKKKLSVDGLAGKKTLEALYADQSAAAGTSSSSSSVSTPTPAPAPTPAPDQQENSSGSSSASDGTLFSGNYATISIGQSGSRVKILQQALISLKYLSGKADGVFGPQTQKAVIQFQTKNKLEADGLAGKKTLKALEKAMKQGSANTEDSTQQVSTPTPTPSPSGDQQSTVTTVSSVAPDGSSIRLLHWFNDIKPALKSGDTLLIYDPSTGISWNLRVYSRGRHCDCEPLTKEDTEKMVKAFGDKNTWNQKGVYVRLPSGVWTVGSTHDMPHMSGSVKDNDFNGHLCVHFLRDMSEAQANDPNYGVSNQETIRQLWKKLTGEEITY